MRDLLSNRSRRVSLSLVLLHALEESASHKQSRPKVYCDAEKTGFVFSELRQTLLCAGEFCCRAELSGEAVAALIKTRKGEKGRLYERGPIIRTDRNKRV